MDGGLDVTQAMKPWSRALVHAALPVVVCGGSYPCSSPGLSKEMGSSHFPREKKMCFPKQPLRKTLVLGDN